MRCIVTGAAGFVGSSIVDRLLDAGHDVTGIDCFVDYYPRERKEKNLQQARDSERFTFIEGDLLQLDLCSVLEGADWIFHQAAQAGVRGSWGDDFRIYTDNNILGSQRLLEASRSEAVSPTLKKFVYASSSSIYGNAEQMPTTEDVLPKPVSPYGVSKLAAEQLAVLYATELGVPTVSLRYFTVYGPRQRPDMAFHRLLHAGLSGETFQVFGDGTQSRDFTFIADIVDANLAAANSTVKGEVCNVGGGSRVTLKEVISEIEQILDKKLNLEFHERSVGDARHTSADISRARELLTYQPKTSLAEGLRRHAEWMESYLSQL